MSNKQDLIEQIGEMSESKFISLCSDYGLTATSPKKDKYGWDAFVEFPEEDTDITPLKILVQVKGTKNNKIEMKLSTCNQLIKTSMPVFIVVFKFKENPTTIDKMYIIFFDKKLTYKLLREVELARVDGKKLHIKKHSFNLNEYNTIDFNDPTFNIKETFENFIETKDLYEYSLQKINQYKSLTQERHLINMQLSVDESSKFTENMFDLHLGLKKEFEVKPLELNISTEKLDIITKSLQLFTDFSIKIEDESTHDLSTGYAVVALEDLSSNSLRKIILMGNLFIFSISEEIRFRVDDKSVDFFLIYNGINKSLKIKISIKEFMLNKKINLQELESIINTISIFHQNSCLKLELRGQFSGENINIEDIFDDNIDFSFGKKYKDICDRGLTLCSFIKNNCNEDVNKNFTISLAHLLDESSDLFKLCCLLTESKPKSQVILKNENFNDIKLKFNYIGELFIIPIYSGNYILFVYIQIKSKIEEYQTIDGTTYVSENNEKIINVEAYKTLPETTGFRVFYFKNSNVFSDENMTIISLFKNINLVREEFDKNNILYSSSNYLGKARQMEIDSGN